MPTATFATSALAYVDNASGGAAHGVGIGVLYLGGVKQFIRREMYGFELFGPAYDGRPLNASDIITAADLLIYPTYIPGASGFPCSVKHIAQPAWDWLTASWNNYNATNPWISGGGDFDTPPADVAFSAPVAIDAWYTIAGLLEFVTDAIANEAGVVRAAIKADDEATASTRFFSHDNDNQPTFPRLTVTYTSQDPREMEHPSSGSATLAGSMPVSPGRGAPASKPARPARRKTRHQTPDSRQSPPKAAGTLQEHPWPQT